MKHLRRVLEFFLPEAPRVLGAVGLLGLATVAGLLKPWPLAVLVDGVLGTKGLPGWLEPGLGSLSVSGQVAVLAAVTLALHVGQAALAAGQSHLLIGVGLAGLARVRNRVFEQLQRLAPGFHQRMASGDLMYRATWDTYAFQTLFQQGLFAFGSAALSLALMVGVMGRLHLPLTLAALATLPLLLAGMRVFGRRMGEQSLVAHAADSRVTSAVQQSMAALPLIQSCNREREEAVRFAGRVEEAFRTRRAQHGWEVAYLAAIGVMFGIGTALILWLGARAVSEGALSVGTLLVFVAYLGQFYEPLHQLSRVGTVLSDAGAGTRRVFEILDDPEVVREVARARPVVSGHGAAREAGAGVVVARGNLRFGGVGFAYEPGRPVLAGVDLEILAGEYVAVVGPSGAGKSTLLHLLPRFRDPTAGAIWLEGVDLRELRLADLRSQMALVFQEPILLPATVEQNIAFGRRGAPREAVERAAREAGADEFIRRLPQGYDTPLGDGAMRLSVGERQRLHVARVFLQDAPVLLLDEPTSALDAESEGLVAAGLGRLRRGRTTLLVTHRAGALPRPDRVVQLVEGRVQREGTPEEVAAVDPAFERAFGSWLGHG